jgi:hypothetical protein
MGQKFMGQNTMNELITKKIRCWSIVIVIGALYFAAAVLVAIERNKPKFNICPLCNQEVQPPRPY